MTKQRILRGGSCYYTAWAISARAYAHRPGWSRLYGFRLVVVKRRKP